MVRYIETQAFVLRIRTFVGWSQRYEVWHKQPTTTAIQYFSFR